MGTSVYALIKHNKKRNNEVIVLHFLFTSYYIVWKKNHEFWEKHFIQFAKREYFQSFKMEALNVLCRIYEGGGGGGGRELSK